MIYNHDAVDTLLDVYVDDLLLMGPAARCTKVAAKLEAMFTLTSMGEAKYLHGHFGRYQQQDDLQPTISY